MAVLAEAEEVVATLDAATPWIPGTGDLLRLVVPAATVGTDPSAALLRIRTRT